MDTTKRGIVKVGSGYAHAPARKGGNETDWVAGEAPAEAGRVTTGGSPQDPPRGKKPACISRCPAGKPAPPSRDACWVAEHLQDNVNHETRKSETKKEAWACVDPSMSDRPKGKRVGKKVTGHAKDRAQGRIDAMALQLRRARKRAEREKQERHAHVAAKLGWRRDLCAEGVEPNPGPQGKDRPAVPLDQWRAHRLSRSAPVSSTVIAGVPPRAGYEKSDRRRAKQRHLHKEGAPGSLKVVTEQLVDATARLEAVEDVKAEFENSEEMEEARKEADRKAIAAKLVRIMLAEEKRLGKVEQAIPEKVAWHCGHESTVFAPYQEVGAGRKGLTPFPFPHRVAVAKRIHVRACTAYDQESGVLVGPDGRETPHHADLHKPAGEFHWVTYSIKIRSMDFEMGVVNVEERELGFSLEQWIAAKSRRIAAAALSVSVKSVKAFRSAVNNFGEFSYKRGGDTQLNDELFTALLLVESVGAEGPSDVAVAIAKRSLSSFVRDEVMATEGKLVEGYYLKGYEVGLQDLFPDKFKAAAEKVRTKVMDAREAAEELGAQLGAKAGGFTALREKPGDWLRAFQARMAPVHIRDFYPLFPNSKSVANQVAGMFKRITPDLGPVSDYAREAERAVADAMIQRLRDRSPEGFSRARIESDAAATALAHGEWAEMQQAEFIRGALKFADMVESRQRVQDDEALHQAMKEFKVFLKTETYPALKAPRYIVCPSHYIRGFLFAAISGAEHRFFETVRESVTKYMTPEERNSLRERMFAGEGNCMENDFTSFESHIDRRRQMEVEARVIEAACDEESRDALLSVFEVLAEGDNAFSATFGSGFLPTIRLSGTYHTSLANNIQNRAITFAAVCHAMRLPASEAGRVYLEWNHPYLVEGDDLLMALPANLEVAAVMAAAADHGNQMKSKKFPAADEANYCGSHSVRVGDRLVPVRDSLEALAKLFCDLAPDVSCGKADAVLMLSKARSFAFEMGPSPILAPVIEALEVRFRDAGRVLDKAVAEARGLKAPISLGMVKVSGAVRKTVASRVKDLRARYGEGVWKHFARAEKKEVPVELREALASEHGIPPAQQVEIEQSLVQQIRAGMTVLECKTLAEIKSRSEGARRMVCRHFESKREEWKKFVSAQEAPIREACNVAAFAPKMLGLGAVSWALNLVLLTISAGSAAVLFMLTPTWLMALAWGVGIGFGVLLGVAVLVELLSWIGEVALGIPREWGKRALRCVAWVFLGMVALCWVRLWWKRRTAVSPPATPARAAPPPKEPEAAGSGGGSASDGSKPGRGGSSFGFPTLW